MFFIKRKSKKDEFIELLKNMPFYEENEYAEEVDLNKFPVNAYKEIFRQDKYFHQNTYKNMDLLIYYAEIWIQLGCPYYTEDDLINYFKTPNISKTYILLDNIRALYIATPPIIYYSEEADRYGVIDGRHRIIALSEAAKKTNLPVKLIVSNSKKNTKTSINRI